MTNCTILLRFLTTVIILVAAKALTAIEKDLLTDKNGNVLDVEIVEHRRQLGHDNEHPNFNASLLTNCVEWVLGYTRESCTETCDVVGRACDSSHLDEIVTMSEFEAMVASSYLLGTTERPESVSSYCNMGTNVFLFASAPAAFAYRIWVEGDDDATGGVYVDNHYCVYPTSLTALAGDCEVSFTDVPAQRFCPCVVPGCGPPSAIPSALPSVLPTEAPIADDDDLVPDLNECLEWILGYGRESCTLTCTRMSRVCRAGYLETVLTSTAFDQMVASSYQISLGGPTGTSGSFCNKGVNTYTFSASPAAFTYQLHTPIGLQWHTYCNFPTSLNALVSDCDVKYIYPPAQRFCPCLLEGCDAPTATPSMNVVTAAPTELPTELPTADPTTDPSADPTVDPTTDPSADPTVDPTTDPSANPTVDPTTDPSANPTVDPTTDPSADPTVDPTTDPSADPTVDPTTDPSADPTVDPTTDPSADPTVDPTTDPSADPTTDPTANPTVDPTVDPTTDPSANPTVDPTVDPTTDPTANPTVDPTTNPSANPTVDPTTDPTADPTTVPTTDPTVDPTTDPTADPTAMPTLSPTTVPTVVPTTATPTLAPTGCFHWILGYSTWSCDETCADPSVQGTCYEEAFANSIGRAGFDEMIAESFLLGSDISGRTRPNNTDEFCNFGILDGTGYNFATAPAVIAYLTYTNVNGVPTISANYQCWYPSISDYLTGDCTSVYTNPPAQRFCPCAIPDCTAWENTHPAARRNLLSDTTAEG